MQFKVILQSATTACMLILKPVFGCAGYVAQISVRSPAVKSDIMGLEKTSDAIEGQRCKKGATMSKRTDEEFDQIAEQLDENILAVKGTLELLDTAITEDDLRELLLKAVGRMDTIQSISIEMLATLKNCIGKINEGKE